MSSERAGTQAGRLSCPRCGRSYPVDERFCADCGMPLVHAGQTEQHPVTEAQQRARKVKPQYTGGEQVRVASARNLAEAELIQGMLLEEGVPSVQRRMRGFDVPDFLAAGPRDILVPEAGADAARRLLAEVAPDAASPHDAPAPGRPLRLMLGLLVAFGGAGVIAWLLYQLVT